MHEETINIFVQDTPKPGGSKRAFVVRTKTGGQRAIVTDDCKKNKEWRTSVREAAIRAMEGKPPFQGRPALLNITFIMPRPNGHYGSGRNADVLKPNAPKYHISKPDCLKLARSTEDALTGIVWADDSANCVLKLSKIYSDNRVTGAIITVTFRADNLRDGQGG